MNTALEPQSHFVATLKLTSDWHIGVGAGRPGEIDRLIQRDGDGLPLIPAKTLTGIWRDTCETVALGLDNGQPGVWTAWVTYLFGDQPAIATAPQVQTQAHAPQPAALSIRAAYFSADFKAAITGNKPLLAAMTFVKPGIAIEADTGCAKDNFLRFEEMARAGATLQADCELSLKGLDLTQQRVAYGLLVVSTKLMTRLGGKRRRGAGGCELSIVSSIQAWLNWLGETPQPPSPPVIAAQSENNPQWWTGKSTLASTDIPADWLSLPLKITAQSPLVMACRTLGNVVETLDYIPGSHLLRFMMQRLGGLGVNLAQAIAHQELLITNATIEIQNQRGLPIPLALSGTKLGGGLEKGGTVYNRLAETVPKTTQLKGERGGYLVLGQLESGRLEHLPLSAKVDKAVLTHNTIDDAVQRPTQKVGGVYSYEAIVPGTAFRAELRITTALANQLGDIRDDWWQLLTGTARLGQSKKDSYGQVIVTAAKPEKAITTTEIASAGNHQLTVWLLSDLLLRNERLRPSTSVHDLAQALSEYLGCQMVPKEEPSLLSQIARSHRIESWQVRWGLPRPSLTGFAAGSCFVFQCADEQQIDPQKLTELTIEGLGNRRVEGFGQLSFNSPLLTQPASELTHPISDDASATPSGSTTLISPPTGAPTEEIRYARCIEKVAWRDAIQKAAEALAASPNRREHYLGFSGSQPGMSQLGSLRSLLTRLNEPQQQTVTTWLSRVREKRSEKWPAGSLGKLTTLLNNDNSIWQILNEGIELAALPAFHRLVLVRGDESWLRTELWTEAVQILMATCIRAHKRALENDLNSTEDNSNYVGGTNNGTAA